MQIFPEKTQFISRYNDGSSQLVWATLGADRYTPLSAFSRLTKGQSYRFLLESVEHGSSRGRYSVIGWMPDLLWVCNHNGTFLHKHHQDNPPIKQWPASLTLESLRQFISQSQIADFPANLPSPACGVFGYLGYEMARFLEVLPESLPDSYNLPDATLIRPQMICLFDSVYEILHLITPVWQHNCSAHDDAFLSAQQAYDQAVQRLECAFTDLQETDKLQPLSLVSQPIDMNRVAQVSNIEKSHFLDMIERCKSYIREGDAFQIVPSQRFTVPLTASPLDVYRCLRHLNPSPYMFFFESHDAIITGSSPEILVRLHNQTVTIRPIAGTRPRSDCPVADREMEQSLLSDQKERAEHLMLIDLGRNDVGRVCEIGSIEITEQFSIERYSHVMHIVSNITGKIKPNCDAIDALLAGLPAGTVSGAPKIRAMEIINELEHEKRGFYAGGLGYFSADGNMDTCILLRTALIKDNKAIIQAGCGIVADSQAEAEYEETINKAMALFHAVQMANQQVVQK